MPANRQCDIASLPRSSSTAAHMPSDSKISSSDREPSKTFHEPDKIISLVSGAWIPVPRTYDPDTYDPEGQMPWTPEPEPYDPETYATWGRKHFGDDWYEQRRTMLQERNIYGPDAVYRHRQRDLRVMEHKIEGRPFRPRGEKLDEGWQRLWARLSKDLPSVETPGTLASFQLIDSGSNVSKKLLELNRRRFLWDQESYQFERILRKEALIDKARKHREDEEGDRRREEELEEIQKIIYLPGTLVKSGEYDDRMRKWNLRGKGWTQEQIEAADRADIAAWKWQMENPQPKGLSIFGPPLTQEEKNKYNAWCQKERAARLHIYGGHPPSESGTTDEAAYDTWRRNIHTRVSRQREEDQREQEPRADATADASAPEKATKNTSRKTRGGRIIMDIAQSQSVANRDTRPRRITPRLNPGSNAGRRPKRARAIDVLVKPEESTAQIPRKTRKHQPKACQKRASAEAHDINSQVLQSKPHNTKKRKVYKQERRSRRLAGKLPEYGMLPERGATAPTYEPPSNTC
ncbi:hypothetical protein ONS96_007466 [Cadophora gregata f. sp. sojae]|nr:hypothetical protein ONS96_007466 [Cadophora gregata f. sp. sojae]